LPTIVDSVPLWCNSTGTALKQQLSTDVGIFAGPITSNAGTDPLFASQNVFFGADPAYPFEAAGASNVDGTNNCAFGVSALSENVDGNNCSAFGYGALQSNMDGQNVAVGTYAGIALTTGANNVMIGYGAGAALNTGENNTIVGAGSGQSELFTGNYNVIVGYNIDGPSDSNIVIGTDINLNSQTGCIAIGQGVTPINSNELILQLGSGNYAQTQFTTDNTFVNGSGAALQAPTNWLIITINGVQHKLPLFT
jgi:hypothetical protein